jgi:hypothetical protein
MFVTDDPARNLSDLIKAFHPYMTPLSVLSGLFLLGWKTKTFVNHFIHTHLVGAKEEIVSAIAKNTELEKEMEEKRHAKLIEAVKTSEAGIAKVAEKTEEALRISEKGIAKVAEKTQEALKISEAGIARVAEKTQNNHEKLVDAINSSSDRVIGTLIAINKK